MSSTREVEKNNCGPVYIACRNFQSNLFHWYSALFLDKGTKYAVLNAGTYS